jgi:hypothetical protein
MVSNVANILYEVSPLLVDKAFRGLDIMNTWRLTRWKMNNTIFRFLKHFVSFEMAICGYTATSELVKFFAKFINDVQLLHVEKAFRDFTILK